MITTHVLDTSVGRPGQGIAIVLDHQLDDGAWTRIGSGVTDDDGRLRTLTARGTLATGVYRLRFETGPHYAARSITTFFPVVELHFSVGDGAQHYHVPLLLSPFGFSTYRGS